MREKKTKTKDSKATEGGHTQSYEHVDLEPSRSSTTSSAIPRRAVVLVCGDLGRSPRMQFHALSLADQAGFEVDFVGYTGSAPYKAVTSNPRITLHRFSPLNVNIHRRFLYLFLAVFKAAYMFLQTLWALFRVHRPDFVLVQNPPSIPTLLAAHIVCFLRRSKLVIDWHNFGYTILGMVKGEQHWSVRVAKWYEKKFGKGAHANFCVTNAMAKELEQNWGIRAIALHDRPPEEFHLLNPEEKHKLFVKMHASGFLKDFVWDAQQPSEQKASNSSTKREAVFTDEYDAHRTLFTEFDGKAYKLRDDRPSLVISSTSWTDDENFDYLLDAVVACDKKLATKQSSKRSDTEGSLRMLFVITGKGPNLPRYKQKIAELDLKRCKILTVWLAADDYPKLLGAADLGVCLHVSSSGLDLPMKVVDMFGCGLPVCAVGFSCLNELVLHRQNGLVFSTSTELADQLMSLFSEFPVKTSDLDKMRGHIQSNFRTKSWQQNWNEVARPVWNV